MHQWIIVVKLKIYEKGFLLGYYIEKGARYFWGKKSKYSEFLKP